MPALDILQLQENESRVGRSSDLMTSCLQCVAVFSALRVDLGALVEQHSYHHLVAFRWSRLECVAVLYTLRVDFGALVKQQRYQHLKSSFEAAWRALLKCPPA
jgi:hypothetical protein